MELDLDSAARRFSREQGTRQQQAAQRRSQLRAEREKTRSLQLERERELARREAEAAEIAAQEAKLRDEDLERNRGVAYHARLRCVLSLEGEQRRIHRRADKITLPRSAAAELSNASKNGQLFFELTAPAGKRTHASILDYVAADATVGVPPQARFVP